MELPAVVNKEAAEKASFSSVFIMKETEWATKGVLFIFSEQEWWAKSIGLLACVTIFTYQSTACSRN